MSLGLLFAYSGISLILSALLYFGGDIQSIEHKSFNEDVQPLQWANGHAQQISAAVEC